MVAVHVRHAQIGDDDLEGTAAGEAGAEHLQALPAAVGEADIVVFVFQTVPQDGADGWLVVNTKDAHGAGGLKRGGGGLRGRDRLAGDGEAHADASTLARRAFNLNSALVALHHSINHGQAQAGSAAMRLGGEERLQAVAAD